MDDIMEGMVNTISKIKFPIRQEYFYVNSNSMDILLEIKIMELYIELSPELT